MLSSFAQLHKNRSLDPLKLEYAFFDEACEDIARGTGIRSKIPPEWFIWAA